MSNRWQHERKGEFYYNKAKEEGYRSRSSYKLKQINSKFKIFKHAKNVLDLGAAPGGWIQVVSEEMMDEQGLILGVDLKEIKPLYKDNVETIVGDVRDPEVQEEILEAFFGKADVILSDMAPDVMGQWDVDQYRQIHLARIGLKLCDTLLKVDDVQVRQELQAPCQPQQEQREVPHRPPHEKGQEAPRGVQARGRL